MAGSDGGVKGYVGQNPEVLFSRDGLPLLRLKETLTSALVVTFLVTYQKDRPK